METQQQRQQEEREERQQHDEDAIMGLCDEEEELPCPPRRRPSSRAPPAMPISFAELLALSPADAAWLAAADFSCPELGGRHRASAGGGRGSGSCGAGAGAADAADDDDHAQEDGKNAEADAGDASACSVAAALVLGSPLGQPGAGGGGGGGDGAGDGDTTAAAARNAARLRQAALCVGIQARALGRIFVRRRLRQAALDASLAGALADARGAPFASHSSAEEAARLCALLSASFRAERDVLAAASDAAAQALGRDLCARAAVAAWPRWADPAAVSQAVHALLAVVGG